MIQLASVLIIMRSASSEVCDNKDNIPCPGPEGGCLPPSSVCDGWDTCRHGEDEELQFCLSWNCSQGLVKCPDNLQCIAERSACAKAQWRYHRHEAQYDNPCKGTTDMRLSMTIPVKAGAAAHWRCAPGKTDSFDLQLTASPIVCRVGIDCSAENVWTCGSECISRYYLCDGVTDCEVQSYTQCC